MLRWLAGSFSIDLRSLAALRVGLGTMIVIDLASRARDLTAHYTDSGVFPRTARIALEHDPATRSGPLAWSLHMASGAAWGQAMLFLAAAWFAVWLVIGYRTRLATVASWLFAVSLYNRNPLLEDAGDTILRCVLFWSMFLPLGAVASIDRRLRPGDSLSPRAIVSIPSAALLLQICMVYWCTAAEKWSPIWTSEHTALYFTLSIDAFATPLGHWLLAYPQFLSWLTVGVYWLEWVGPLVALSPVFNGWPRLMAVLAFWALHFGTAVTMELGTLPWISMMAWLVFLPGVFWDKLGFRQPQVPYAPSGNCTSALVTILLVYVAVWNVNQVTGAFEQRWPGIWKAPGHLTGLEQTWRMFAPQPMIDDGWYEMKGVLADGSVVNLWQPDQPLPTRKPASVAATYRNQRWRKYLLDIRIKWDAYRPQLADWLRRRWDDDFSGGLPERRVQRIEIVYHLEETLSPDRSSTLVVPEITYQADYP